MKLDEIVTWKDWCKTFQDINTFKSLIHTIFTNHRLPLETIENTYPGTNAVFRVGKYVVKIFVPASVKPWQEDDYGIELNHAQTAQHVSNYTPHLYASGSIQKVLGWNYLVFEYIDGTLFYQVRDALTSCDKRLVVQQLKAFLSAFNTSPKHLGDTQYIIERVVTGKRWDFLKPAVKEALFKYLKTVDRSQSVRVHGDLTGDNILFTNQGIQIIDFADSCMAPFYYEYAPIILDLFQCDYELVSLFFDDMDHGIELTIKSVLLHDFGGDFAKELLEAEPIDSLETLLATLRYKIIKKVQLGL